MALTKEQRDQLPADDFAVPGKRALPIQDAKHVSMAWDMVDRTKDLTDAERAEARRRILERAKKLGMDTSNWNRVKAMAWELDTLSAMSLAVPETPDHPNKLPFTGVLTFVDQPSNAPPGGSGGKLVVVTRAAAERALPTLLGMAIDYTPNLDGHDPTAKIGLIESATIDGNAIKIGGFFYAHDFPEEVAAIRKHKELLGFSFEAERIRVADMTAPILVVVDLIFTGAAVLQKDKAAYRTTSLAASKDPASEQDMEKLDELLASVAKLGEGLKQVTDQVGALTKKVESGIQAGDLTARMKPHSDRLTAAADAMEADGIGGHAQHGHPAILRRMASSLMANAAMGKVPHTCDEAYRASADALAASAAPKVDEETKNTLATLSASIKTIGEGLANVTTIVTDLKAKSINIGDQPERKTLPPRITSLLAKGGIALPEDGKGMTVSALDQAFKTTSLDPMTRIEIKTALSRAGLLKAA